MYPFSDYKYGSFPQKEEEKNVVFVYDRGTLMDTLANVRGSYIWTCSTLGDGALFADDHRVDSLHRRRVAPALHQAKSFCVHAWR